MSKVKLEYVWLDGYKTPNLRSKIRIEKHKPGSYNDCPIWGFDGSSTLQADGNYSDCVLQPVKLYLYDKNHYIVFCQVMEEQDVVHETNKRHHLENFMDNWKDLDLWFAVEQEFTFFDKDGISPYGWEKPNPNPQGRYYCGVGSDVIRGRRIMDEFTDKCLEMDLPICGTNAEVMMSQWEYQLGPTDPLSLADDLWVSRYILNKIAEKYNATVKLDPKPVLGDWNGSGAHINFSTKDMRNALCLEDAEKMCEGFGAYHSNSMADYGINNSERLTGNHETCHYKTFKFGESDRGASIRIPKCIVKEGKGYLEDRRPAANMDPYVAFYSLATLISLQTK